MTQDDAPPWYVQVAEILACMEEDSLTVAVDTYMVRGVGLQPATWGEMRGVGRKAVTRSLRRAEKQLGVETLVQIIDGYDGDAVLDSDAEAAAPDHLTNGTPPADAHAVDVTRLADALETIAQDDDRDLDAAAVQATLEDEV